MIDVQSRLRQRVAERGGCWEWTRAKSDRGYGVAWFQGKLHLAHRLFYQVFVGEIPAGMLVCHTCDNRKCCNPDHLFLGTHQENADDMVAKGRQCRGAGRSKLTADQVLEIRARYASGDGPTLLGREYGVAPSTVSCIVSRKSWGHV